MRTPEHRCAVGAHALERHRRGAEVRTRIVDGEHAEHACRGERVAAVDPANTRMCVR
jgi:hypothetical protein